MGIVRPNSVSNLFAVTISVAENKARAARSRCSIFDSSAGSTIFRHADGVDFIARLHHFLFEIEEDFGEARLLFGQREDSLIHDLQAERGLTPSPVEFVTRKRMRASSPGL